jgi:hypothetical protein
MPRLSARQLVIVAVSVAAGAVLGPVSVSYAVNQLVSIADPTTNVAAHVGADGTLNVESRAGVPQRAFNLYVTVYPGDTLLTSSTPANRVAITEMTVNQAQLPGGSAFYLEAWVDQSKTKLACPADPPSGTPWKKIRLRDIAVPGFSNGTLQLHFDGPPFLAPDEAGSATCLYANNYYAQAILRIGITGYRYSG